MSYKEDFINFIIQIGALEFGEFTLKSGRVSPYFFNASLFSSAHNLSRLGYFYAKTIIASKIKFDILFGAAYKGIPLASATAISLYKDFDINISYSFNRKEKKDYGEGGSIVGADLVGDIFIIDDVITAGTAVSEVLSIMQKYPVNVKAMIVALDRKERGKNNISATQEVAKFYNITVLSIITIDDIIEYLKNTKDNHLVTKINLYGQKYGI